MRRFRRLASVLGLSLLLMCGWVPLALALQSSSTHYGVDQVQFGSGGLVCDPTQNDGSADYCASQSLGETGAGGTCSTTYCAQAGGPETDRQPYLEFKVNNTYINIGVLNSNSTKVANATFSVKSYLAGGYTVVTASPPPQNGNYTLKTLTSPQGPSIGNEQFGINLRLNVCPSNAIQTGSGGCPASPGTFGADPVQIPDASFSSGHAASATDNPSDGNYYNVANKYVYKEGDVIAASNSSSGETDYTISYVFNTTNVTPGGTYTMNQVLVATSTF